MSDNHAETPATVPDSLKVTLDPPCADCATSGEKILAGLAFLFAVFIIVMAADMFTGGKITGLVASKTGGD